MTTPTLLTAFNDHFMEFVNAIVERFPEDLDLVTSKNFLELAKKSNPKMIIKVFYSIFSFLCKLFIF